MRSTLNLVHSRVTIASSRRGRPRADMCQSTSRKRSSLRRENALHSSLWPCPRTLTPKWLASQGGGQALSGRRARQRAGGGGPVLEDRSTKKAMRGESSDTEVKEPTVIPTGPDLALAVTTATLVGTCPRARR